MEEISEFIRYAQTDNFKKAAFIVAGVWVVYNFTSGGGITETLEKLNLFHKKNDINAHETQVGVGHDTSHVNSLNVK
jgi:hypothetical protein